MLFTSIFPSIMSDLYKMMMGSESSGEWIKIYDSSNNTNPIERCFHLFKASVTENTYPNLLSLDDFVHIVDKYDGDYEFSTDDLTQLFEKHQTDGGVKVHELCEIIEDMARQLSLSFDDMIKMLGY